MNTSKAVPSQGRTFFVAELYRAAFMLDISDGACRVLCAIISNLNMNAADPEFGSTFVGQDWIAVHISKNVRNVRVCINELIGAGIVSVVRRGYNTTNKTYVNVSALLALGKSRHNDALVELDELRGNDDQFSCIVSEGAPASGPDRTRTPCLDRMLATPDLSSRDLVSRNLVSLDASSPATQPKNAKRVESDDVYSDEAIRAGSEYVKRTTVQISQALDAGIINERSAQFATVGIDIRKNSIGKEVLRAKGRNVDIDHVTHRWIHEFLKHSSTDKLYYANTLVALLRGKHKK